MKRQMLVLLLPITLLGLACNPPVMAPPNPTVSAPRQIVESSTPKGSEIRVTVGNPVLKVKDYWVVTQTNGSMTPSQGFTFTGGPNTIQVADGQQLIIWGSAIVDGKTFTALRIPGNSIKILVDPTTGALYQKALNGEQSQVAGVVTMMWSFTSSPENITFKPSQTESVASSQTYTNFEFIYSGKTGNSINFLYREYTAQDLARPSYFQNVSYEATEKEILFKSLRLEVLEVGSSFIRVKVAEF
jgi:hypothetical protein